MYVGVLPACIPGALGQKAALDHLELELQTVVSCHVSGRN